LDKIINWTCGFVPNNRNKNAEFGICLGLESDSMVIRKGRLRRFW